MITYKQYKIYSTAKPNLPCKWTSMLLSKQTKTVHITALTNAVIAGTRLKQGGPPSQISCRCWNMEYYRLSLQLCCLEHWALLNGLRDNEAQEAQHGGAAQHDLGVGREGCDAERPVLATLPRHTLQGIIEATLVMLCTTVRLTTQCIARRCKTKHSSQHKHSSQPKKTQSTMISMTNL